MFYSKCNVLYKINIWNVNGQRKQTLKTILIVLENRITNQKKYLLCGVSLILFLTKNINICHCKINISMIFFILTKLELCMVYIRQHIILDK